MAETWSMLGDILVPVDLGVRWNDLDRFMWWMTKALRQATKTRRITLETRLPI